LLSTEYLRPRWGGPVVNEWCPIANKLHLDHSWCYTTWANLVRIHTWWPISSTGILSFLIPQRRLTFWVNMYWP